MRALAACLLVLAATTASLAGLPSGFTETIVVSGLGEIRSFDWTPSGDLWVAVGQGRVYVCRPGVAPILALQIAVEPTYEHGLNALAVDPDFATNHYIWLYYTAKEPTRNRLSRFTAVGDTLVSETVMLESPPLSNFFHTGGCLRFAKDKTLFLGMGEDNQAALAQDPHELRGKILHLQRDGSPAPDNPYLDGVSGDPRVWALGLRNPFRCNIHPVTGDFYVADVGAGTFEEIDIGLPGANFGWPQVEGPAPRGVPGYVYPIYSYDHSAPGAEAIIGGVHAGLGDFAPQYEGDYFFGDWALGKLWRMKLDATNAMTSVELFSDQAPAVVELRFGPDHALYYASNWGTLRRIAYVASGNRPPAAVAAASVDEGAAPLAVTFDASGSWDPDQDALAFDWDLGDGTLDQGATVHHAYPSGVWNARASVTDSGGNIAASPWVRIVSGNERPSAALGAPSGQPYTAGQTIFYEGTGSDPEDGTLPCANFTWRVVRNHGGHAHAFQGPLQGTCQGSFTTADRGESFPDETYDVLLSAADSGSPLGSVGSLAGTAAARVAPATASVTYATQPLPDLNLALDGTVFTAPLTETSVVNFVRTVRALEPQLRPDGHTWRWLSWSDSGERKHEVRAPAGGGTFVATFGCDVLDEVKQLRVGKATGGRVTLSWQAMTDPCLRTDALRYQIYVATSLTPASTPGSFPVDPAFTLAGSTSVNTLTRSTGPATEFYLVVGAGTDGRNGPVGHYGF
ncbi:MAG TPA: PQQ-dependent sugar dehydrogenase [Candidatus Polarisedimenticolaceae bacterium]|nr:PQQ-dependent sugar dehydrogenase [Candidatus Polarisedimenticolaceae bacterium]